MWYIEHMTFIELKEGQFFMTDEFGVCEKTWALGYGNTYCYKAGLGTYITIPDDTEVYFMSDADTFRWDNGAF